MGLRIVYPLIGLGVIVVEPRTRALRGFGIQQIRG